MSFRAAAGLPLAVASHVLKKVSIATLASHSIPCGFGNTGAARSLLGRSCAPQRLKKTTAFRSSINRAAKSNVKRPLDRHFQHGAIDLSALHHQSVSLRQR